MWIGGRPKSTNHVEIHQSRMSFGSLFGRILHMIGGFAEFMWSRSVTRVCRCPVQDVRDVARSSSATEQFGTLLFRLGTEKLLVS